MLLSYDKSCQQRLLRDTHDDGCFFVLWMCGDTARPVLKSWVDILQRYSESVISTDDIEIYFPQSALREMCSCLYSYICLPEDNRFEKVEASALAELVFQSGGSEQNVICL